MTQKAALAHTVSILGRAMRVLQDVDAVELDAYKAWEYGTKELHRQGEKRPVHYVVVEGESGDRLRIEVYTLKPVEPVEVSVDA